MESDTDDMDFAAADHELSDSEILDRFGPMLAEAVQAFRTDPEIVVGMAEHASELRRKRDARRAARKSPGQARNVARPPRDPEQVARIIELLDTGISQQKVADRLHISRGTVRRIKRQRMEQSDTQV